MTKIINSINEYFLVSESFLNLIKTCCCKFNITPFHIFYYWAVFFCCYEPNLIVWHLIVKDNLWRISWVDNFLLNSILTHWIVKKQRIRLRTKPIRYHMSIFLTHNILQLCQTIQKYRSGVNPYSTLLLENNHS